MSGEEGRSGTEGSLRQAAERAELRGDWEDAKLMKQAADQIMTLKAANAAYRHALSSGVSINMVGKKSLFKRDDSR